MTTGITNVSAYNSLFASIYERALLVARANCVMAQLVTPFSDSSGTEQRIFSEREQATAQSVSEGTDYQSPDRMGKSSIATLTPGEVMAQTTISMRALRQDPQVREDAGTELGLAMAQKIDQDLISVFPSLTGSATGGPLGAAGSAHTWGIQLAAQAQLHAGNVPPRYNVVLHPYQAFDLTSAVNLVKDLASTPESVKNGLAADMFLGRYQMMDFYVSNNIDIDGSDDAKGAIFNAGAIALDTRVAPQMLPPEFDASAREWELNIYADYAYGVRRPTWGIDIDSDATAPVS